MPWLQIKLRADRSRAPALAEALEAAGAISVSIEGEGDEQLLEAGLTEGRLWHDNRVIGLFPEHTDVEAVRLALRQQLGLRAAPALEADLLGDEDWAQAWKAHYHPIAITSRLWVCPSWLAPPDPSAVTVLLDPGLAFGTGDHPTTALCLEWLAEQALRGRTLIDYGCGSGILSIAALKLGAAHALGIDIDPLALAVSLENAARNGVEERFAALSPAGLRPGASADLVVANILAGPLQELAAVLSALVRPGGRLALCGMLKSQADAVYACYGARFWLEARARGEWVLLAGEPQST